MPFEIPVEWVTKKINRHRNAHLLRSTVDTGGTVYARIVRGKRKGEPRDKWLLYLKEFNGVQQFLCTAPSLDAAKSTAQLICAQRHGTKHYADPVEFRHANIRYVSALVNWRVDNMPKWAGRFPPTHP